MDHMTSEILGYVGGTLTTASFLPQVIKTAKSKSTKDISLVMYLMFTCGVVCWLLHGLGLGSMPMVLANAVVLVLTLAILIMKLKLG